LVRLAEHLLAGARPPRLVVAMPVGFVNASESKEFFLACCPKVPSIVLRGRKGGSPLAASAVNALAALALA
jgi:precorrin-8X/cobalt-precorrin-8 methylmutase